MAVFNYSKTISVSVNFHPWFLNKKIKNWQTFTHYYALRRDVTSRLRHDDTSVGCSTS